MEKLKWGVIGAGGIADRRTLPGMMLAENADLVAVMELDAAHTEALRQKYGAARGYTTPGELLADPEVQAVYIASPVGAHFEQVKAAAEAGKHILVEKPVAMTLDQGLELEALCREKNLLLAAGLMMRFHPCHAALRKMAQENGFGQLVSLRAQLTCWYPDMPGAWRQDLAQSGGGALVDMGIHCIDLLQYITGSRVRRVAAMAGTKTFAYNVDDSATLLLEFENGAQGTVDANFNIPDNAAECRLEIYGTRASALASGTIGQTDGGNCVVCHGNNTEYDAAQAARSGEDGREALAWPEGNPYTREIESFGRSVLSGEALAVPAAEALQVQQVMDCAYQAAREGRTVEVPLVGGKGVDA